MSDIYIDPVVFKKRVYQLQRRLQNGDASLGEARQILVMVGNSDEENPYQKSSVLHTWLLGYEFPATGMLFLKNKVVIITSVSKAKHLQPVAKAAGDGLAIWTRTKDPEHNKKLFLDLIALLEENGPVGVLTKDKFTGKFITEWEEVLKGSGKDFKYVDVSLCLSLAMELKDEDELKSIRQASKASAGIMANYVADEMSATIDEDRKITHAKFSEKIENLIEDDAYFAKHTKDFKLGSDFDLSQVDWCYTPVIQSGGKYDLKPSAVADDELLTSGVIVSFLGIRYKSYCSNVGRTYLIDPTKAQESNYQFLLDLQQYALSLLVDGAIVKTVYGKLLAYIREKNPELEQYFLKSVGWNIGIEFRDSTLLLNQKCDRQLKDGMTLNLALGFHNIPVSKGSSEVYSLLLIDTIRLTNSTPIVFTDAPKALGDVSFYLETEPAAKSSSGAQNAEKSAPKPKTPAAKPDVRARAEKEIRERESRILKTKLRNETTNYDEEAETRRKEHQAQLHAKRQQEGLKRFADQSGSLDGESKPVFKKYESYKRESQIPHHLVKDLKLSVDQKNQTILLPICGRPVPFHINSYKNGSKNEEGDYVYVRLNFNSPGAGVRKDDVVYEDPSSTFLKSITLRSRDIERMSEVFKQISDLKKESLKRQAEKKEMADVVEQANLIITKARKAPRLDSVFVRPSPDGKRVPGSLEIHENGLRYQSPIRSDHKIDILFSNIKHFFFQPSEQELLTLIHCHLKSPIIIGKKKSFDVQFYREAADITADETSNKRRKYRYGDEDELEQEQEERRRRAALDKEFKAFAEKIADASNGLFDVDIPFRELGFNGVPFRSNVLCQPTTDCLVQLIDPPFLVVTLAEIEIAHLERVQFGLKNFDLVFVNKDFTKPVVHINTIPMDQLEAVKDWLDEVDIPFTEGAINLNWATILKTITADPHQFFLDGGWSFLGGDSDNESEDESEEESEFELGSDEAEDDDDDDDDDESEYSEDDSGSESAEDSSEDGEDWDTLDENARKEDERRNRD